MADRFSSWVKLGHEGEDVEKLLAKQGLTLNLGEPWPDSSTRKIGHTATIPGEFIFDGIRVEDFSMNFIDKRLTKVSFMNVSDSDVDKLYNECVQLFGHGIETTWDDKEVREKMENPELCRTCKRYFPTTLIESKVGYTWSGYNRSYIRYALVTMEDWNATGKASDGLSKLEAKQYRELIQSIKSGKKIGCDACNGIGTCKICSGAGKTYDYKFYPCTYPACGGKGWYAVRNSGGGRKSCTICKGTGKIKSYSKEEMP